MLDHLDRLRELFSLAGDHYRKEVQATVEMVATEKLDSERLAKQREKERQAFKHFREAASAYHAALIRAGERQEDLTTASDFTTPSLV